MSEGFLVLSVIVNAVVIEFLHSYFLLQNHGTNFNQTWQNPLLNEGTLGLSNEGCYISPKEENDALVSLKLR